MSLVDMCALPDRPMAGWLAGWLNGWQIFDVVVVSWQRFDEWLT